MIKLKNLHGEEVWYYEITKAEMEEKIKYKEKDIENDRKKLVRFMGRGSYS